MSFSVADLLTSLASVGIAALGGAAVVFSAIDDAPGGVLLGILLIIGAAALSLRAPQPTR